MTSPMNLSMIPKVLVLLSIPVEPLAWGASAKAQAPRAEEVQNVVFTAAMVLGMRVGTDVVCKRAIHDDLSLLKQKTASLAYAAGATDEFTKGVSVSTRLWIDEPAAEKSKFCSAAALARTDAAAAQALDDLAAALGK